MTETTTKTPEELQAAVKPPARRYEVIQPGEYVSRCAYILPNACQCWKAGEERVFEAVPHAGKDEAKERSYQFCERHVRIQKAIDAGVLSKESVSTTLKEQLMDPPILPEPEVKPPKAEEKKPEESKAEKESREREEKTRKESEDREEALKQQAQQKQQVTGGITNAKPAGVETAGPAAHGATGTTAPAKDAEGTGKPPAGTSGGKS